MMLNDFDKEFILSLVKSIQEKGISIADLVISFDVQAFRERKFGLYYYGAEKDIGGSIDSDIWTVREKSLLLKICDQNIDLYSTMLINIVIYLLENPMSDDMVAAI